MSVRVSVITPTCDRPVGFALAEWMMRRQTRQPFEWIVADGGQTPAVCTLGQVQIHVPRESGVRNFLDNLEAGLARATGDVFVWWEDDDWYAPTHLAQLVGQLEADPRALAAGDDDQRYYNLATRQWRTWTNVGACLCQTAMRAEAAPRFAAVMRGCRERGSYGVDTNFWRGVPVARRAIAKTHTVVGIKGLPGRTGLGVGHRPDETWTDDPALVKLRAWIGDDVDVYAALAPRTRAA